MAMTKRGNSALHLQPGWTISEDEFGLLTGEATWEGDFALRHLAPRKGTLHPYDSRLTCYRSTVSRLGADKCRISLGYIGLAQDPTPWVIEHPGGSGQEPIETHPSFASLAGTSASPLNGAAFDENTGEFIGFVNPSNSLCGVRSYIVPSVIVSATYYTHYAPMLGNVGKITSFPPIAMPSSVRNCLLIGQPYQQIGNVFKVTNQYLGSGPGGWNTRIY